MRTGGLDGPVSIKVEAIFTPREIRPRHKGGLLESMAASPGEDCSTSGAFQRTWSGKMKPSKLSRTVVSVKIGNGTTPRNLSAPTEIQSRTRIPTYTSKKRDMLKKIGAENTMKDRIKFSDSSNHRGGPTTSSCACYYLRSTSAAHKFPLSVTASGSLARVTQIQDITATTPTCHKSSLQNRQATERRPPLLATGGSKPRITSIRGSTPQTPTEPNITKSTKTRFLTDHNAPHALSQKQETPPPSLQTSSAIAPMGKVKDRSHTNHDSSYGYREVPDALEKCTLPEAEACRHWAHEPLAKQVDSLNRATKIEEHVEAVRQNGIVGASARTRSNIKGCEYNDMKMLHERSVVAKSIESGPWSLWQADYAKTPKPRWQDFSRPAPLVSQTHTTLGANKKVIGSPSRTNHICVSQVPSSVRQTKVCSAKPKEITDCSIDDRIKTWESKAKSQRRPEEAADYVCSGKCVNKSILFWKNIYKSRRKSDNGEHHENQGLNMEEVLAVVDEFQDKEGGPDDDDAAKGLLKLVAAPAWNRGLLGAEYGAELDELSIELAMRIVVRGADCVLAEPKPLRLLELKRMVLLCRQRMEVC